MVTATLYVVLLLYMLTAKRESDYVRTLHGASNFYWGCTGIASCDVWFLRCSHACAPL